MRALLEKRQGQPDVAVDALDECGCTAIWWAACEGEAEVVDVLLAAGADCHVKGELNCGTRRPAHMSLVDDVSNAKVMMFEHCVMPSCYRNS